MMAVSLWQPWASAIALGHKAIETRSWSTRYRGQIAIHAAKRFAAEERMFASVEHTLGRLPAQLPLGAIVAIAELTGVQPAHELAAGPIEKIYGNYTPGRFGWCLESVRALLDPIPYKGKQGLFIIPDEIFAGAELRPAGPAP